MNFIAHLHLAHLADSSLPGNLLADFVRGNPQADYPADIVDGIFMHRRIDVMTIICRKSKQPATGFARRPAAWRPLRWM